MQRTAVLMSRVGRPCDKQVPDAVSRRMRIRAKEPVRPSFARSLLSHDCRIGGASSLGELG